MSCRKGQTPDYIDGIKVKKRVDDDGDNAILFAQASSNRWKPLGLNLYLTVALQRRACSLL